VQLLDDGYLMTMPEGHRIWVRRGGPAPSEAGVTDVFLHGLGGCSLPLRACVEAVEATGAPTLLIDLRGHGNSERPGGCAHSIAEYTDDVLGVLAAEKVTRANIVGHCLGASVAIRIAELRPELVASLVLVSTSHRFGRGSLGLQRRAGARVADAMLRVLAPRFRVARAYGQADCSHFPRHTDLYWPRLRQDWAHTSPRAVLATILGMCDADLTSALEGTRARTCVVYGTHDLFISRREADEMARLSRAERFELMSDDGHASMVLRSDSPLPEVVREFLHR
jgi:pimeloyl-ACP methyl ester carboxylesterase